MNPFRAAAHQRAWFGPGLPPATPMPSKPPCPGRPAQEAVEREAQLQQALQRAREEAEMHLQVLGAKQAAEEATRAGSPPPPRLAFGSPVACHPTTRLFH